jgi:hypothetical protein
MVNAMPVLRALRLPYSALRSVAARVGCRRGTDESAPLKFVETPAEDSILITTKSTGAPFSLVVPEDVESVIYDKFTVLGIDGSDPRTHVDAPRVEQQAPLEKPKDVVNAAARFCLSSGGRI